MFSRSRSSLVVLAAGTLALLAGCLMPVDEVDPFGQGQGKDRRDAGHPKESRCDAGTILDAGAVVDAGAIEDAGTPDDAGTVEDAGAVEDAGVVVDAGAPCSFTSTFLPPLPSHVHESASFFYDGKIWSLGGSVDNNAKSRAIFSYDPATGAVATSPLTLPVGEAAGFSASKDSVIYIFGGDTGAGLSRSIVRFDARTQILMTMSAQLPTARYNGAAVWVGPYIYLFGGWNGSSHVPDISRYDTVNDTIVDLPSIDSLRREQAAAFNLNGFIYIVSGNIGYSGTNTSVVRFDPGNGSFTTLAVHNPLPRAFTGSASDGRYGYLFGGLNADATPSGLIIRFEPVAEQFTEVGALSLAKHGNPWVWTGEAFITLGGMNVPQWTWWGTVQRWCPP